MIKLVRGEHPKEITEDQVKDWTEKWENNNRDRKKFQWPQINGKKLNDLLSTSLSEWHHHKCAFCEARPEKLEIEHFFSKSKYPDRAYCWDNLFLCCGPCNQSKGDKETDVAIKPDVDDPELFLEINAMTLKIVPKKQLSPEQQKRAETTIKLYKLDRIDLKRMYEAYLRLITHPFEKNDLEVANFNTPRDFNWIATVITENLDAFQQYSEPHFQYSLMVKSYLAYFANV